jgi:hypothetical protein
MLELHSCRTRGNESPVHKSGFNLKDTEMVLSVRIEPEDPNQDCNTSHLCRWDRNYEDRRCAELFDLNGLGLGGKETVDTGKGTDLRGFVARKQLLPSEYCSLKLAIVVNADKVTFTCYL